MYDKKPPAFHAQILNINYLLLGMGNVSSTEEDQVLATEITSSSKDSYSNQISEYYFLAMYVLDSVLVFKGYVLQFYATI